jgi:hypothetical protein
MRRPPGTPATLPLALTTEPAFADDGSESDSRAVRASACDAPARPRNTAKSGARRMSDRAVLRVTALFSSNQTFIGTDGCARPRVSEPWLPYTR